MNKPIFTKQDAIAMKKLRELGYPTADIAELLDVEQHTIVKTLQRHGYNTAAGLKGDIRADYERIRVIVDSTSQPTRYERITGMSVEDLAQAIIDSDVTDAYCKSDCEEVKTVTGQPKEENCLQCCVRWLNEADHVPTGISKP
jgi:IS30 family transposase